MAEAAIRVEVAYATRQHQWLVTLEVPAGTSAIEAVHRSGIERECPGLDTRHIGVFGEEVEPGRRLEDGERVEIYRPLSADPREARRQAARRGDKR